MKALIYLRVSTDKQAGKGLSIPAQREKCLQYAKDNGYEVNEETDIYADEGESARTANRPQFQILWERCRNDRSVKAVIFYDISRLARNRIDFALVKEDLTKRGVKICSATEGIDSSPSGQMLEGVLSTVAEFFSLQSGEKISLTMLGKVEKGGWSGKAPFGYKNVQEQVSSNKSKRWIEVDEKEAPWVPKTFQMFATDNYSLRRLAKILFKDGFPTRNKKPLTQSYLHRMLHNCAYIGKIPYKGKEYNGIHPSLVEPSLFFTVRDILYRRNGGADKSQKHRFALRGISFCGECTSRLTGEEHKKKTTVIRYLRCLKSIKGERVECKQKYFQEYVFNDQFGELMKTIQLPDSFTEKLRERVKKVFSDEQVVYDRMKRSLASQIEKIQKQKEDMFLHFIDKGRSLIDEETYERLKAKLEADEINLKSQLGSTESKLSQIVKTLEIALYLANNCYRAYTKASPDLRGLLARAFFEKLVILNGKIVEAKLNPPLDYLCKNRTKNNPLFKLDPNCGPGENRTRASAMRMPCNTTLLRAHEWRYLTLKIRFLQESGYCALNWYLIL